MYQTLKNFIAIAAVIAAQNVTAETVPSQREVASLPTHGIIIHDTPQGLKIASANNRFVFNGTVTDTWSGKEITNFAEAKWAENHIDFSGINIDFETLTPFKVGDGDKKIIVFIDPTCPACKDLLGKIPVSSQEFKFYIIPIAVRSALSANYTKALSCAYDKSEALYRLLNGNYEGMKVKNDENCSEEEKKFGANRQIFSRVIGVREVPYLVRNDGQIHRGNPVNFQEWLRGQ